MISSLFRYKISHGSTIYEDLDRGMVQGSLVGKGLSLWGFIETADLQGGILGGWFLPNFGSGLQNGVWCYRALVVGLQICLGGFGDYSFPDSLVSSRVWMPRWVRLVMVQSQARCPFLRQ